MAGVMNGATEAVRSWFRHAAEGTEAHEKDVVTQVPGYTDGQIQAALGYLSLNTGELRRIQGPDGNRYTVTALRAPPAEGKKVNKDKDAKVDRSIPIRVLLDGKVVMLEVDGKTLDMSPAAFRALRAKLRDMDWL